MWSNWKLLWQHFNYKRFVIALLLSALLHLFLIGNFYFNLLGINNEKRHFIDAQLVFPKHESPKPELPVVVPKQKLKNNALQKLAPSLPQMPAPVELPSPEQHISSDAVPLSDQLPPAPLDESPASNEVIENQADDAGLIISTNPYKYVESEFDIRTDVDAKVDSRPVGKAKMVYQVLPNGEQYQLKSLMQANGLMSLLIPDLLQTSDGFLTKKGLRPQHYLYKFGDKKNKTFSADFDWESKKLSLHRPKEDEMVGLTEGTQDLLSFMYQFMFVAPMQVMQLSITNGRKLGVYNYSFEGEETLITKMGNLQTIHLLRADKEGDEKTELWLALDYQYVPVKIRKTENEGKVYELLVTSLKTDKPTDTLQ